MSGIQTNVGFLQIVFKLFIYSNSHPVWLSYQRFVEYWNLGIQIQCVHYQKTSKAVLSIAIVQPQAVLYTGSVQSKADTASVQSKAVLQHCKCTIMCRGNCINILSPM